MIRLTLCVLLGVASSLPAAADELSFRTEELPTRLTVGYAVQLLDMNGDDKLDIVIVDSERIIWLENPTWKEHTLIGPGQTKKDNVCFAPHDIDGDGQIDFAVGADWKPFNTESGGTVQWITRGAKSGEPWEVRMIDEEPTVHRMRWADIDGDGRPELCMLPLMGRGTTRPHFNERGVRFLAYHVPADPRRDRWPATVINDELHVTHNFQDVDINGDGKTEFLVVSFEGVHLLQRDVEEKGKFTRFHIGEGNQTTSPNRGASEIKLGRFKSGGKYIATIEPWHGSQVVVYSQPETTQAHAYRSKWRRHVIDEELLWGHGVWCADLDGDGDQELIIGVRDNRSPERPCGLRIYDPQDDSGGNWKRHLIDPGGVAIEDLAAGDLDGDGRIDIVAVGRQTKNVKIYWNETGK